MNLSDSDPRARRTRKVILDAFVGLVLGRRYDAIRTADIVAAADVGRSTFYEHFRGKDEVLIAAAEPILQTFASAALNRANTRQVHATLEHVWQQRNFARRILEGRTGRKLQERLAAMIAARLDPGAPDGVPAPMLAMAAAAAQLTMLRLWVSGAVACPAPALAPRIKACARLVADS